MQEYISSILRSDESNQWMDQMGSSNRDLPRRIWDLQTGTSQDKDGIFILGPARINMGSSNPSVWVNLQGKWGKFRPFVPLSNSQNSSLHHLEVLWGLHYKLAVTCGLHYKIRIFFTRILFTRILSTRIFFTRIFFTRFFFTRIFFSRIFFTRTTLQDFLLPEDYFTRFAVTCGLH